MAAHPPIFLLRHGETQWNTERRLQGRLDSPLTERGCRQAQDMGLALAPALAAAIARHGAAQFHVSPLGRTRQTAALVGRALGIDEALWSADERLAELGYGDWEGRSVAEIEAGLPGSMSRWRADPLGFSPPGGESHRQLEARTRDFLETCRRSSTPLVVVGHGVSGAMLRGLYLDLTPQEIFVLEKPQDAFFRLQDGRIERIAVAI